MNTPYHKLRETIDDFISAANLFTFSNCFFIESPEVNKLAAVTSFKLSYLLYRQLHYANCLVFETIVDDIKASGKVLEIKIIKCNPYEAVIELEPNMLSKGKVKLFCGVYAWNQGELDLVWHILKNEGRFDPLIK